MTFYASDAIMGDGEPMAGYSVMVSLPTNVECKAAFDALADGSRITIPFQPVFWSAGFRTLMDRLGTTWMISSAEEPAKG